MSPRVRCCPGDRLNKQHTPHRKTWTLDMLQQGAVSFHGREQEVSADTVIIFWVERMQAMKLICLRHCHIERWEMERGSMQCLSPPRQTHWHLELLDLLTWWRTEWQDETVGQRRWQGRIKGTRMRRADLQRGSVSDRRGAVQVVHDNPYAFHKIYTNANIILKVTAFRHIAVKGAPSQIIPFEDFIHSLY